MAANPNLDERRYDIPTKEAFTPGEAKYLRYTVREKQPDGTYLNAASFAVYTEWEFYCFEKPGSGGKTQVTRQAGAIFYKPVANINVTGAPYAIVDIIETDTDDVPIGDRWHELWAKVNGRWTRLSYGIMPFVD